MDTRTLLAIVLSIFILIASQEIISYFYPPPPKAVPPQPGQPPAPAVAPAPQPVPEPGGESQAGVAAPPVEKAPATGRDLTVENEVYTATFTSVGGRLKSLRLKHYPGDAGRESPPLEMVKAGTFGELPLAFFLEGKDTVNSDENIPYAVSSGNISLHGSEQATLEFKGKSPSGISITKTFVFFGETYGMD